MSNKRLRNRKGLIKSVEMLGKSSKHKILEGAILLTIIDQLKVSHILLFLFPARPLGIKWINLIFCFSVISYVSSLNWNPVMMMMMTLKMMEMITMMMTQIWNLPDSAMLMMTNGFEFMHLNPMLLFTLKKKDIPFSWNLYLCQCGRWMGTLVTFAPSFLLSFLLSFFSAFF